MIYPDDSLTSEVFEMERAASQAPAVWQSGPSCGDQIAIWWTWCYIALFVPPSPRNTKHTVRWWDGGGGKHQTEPWDFIRLSVLYANTQLTKTKKHLQVQSVTHCNEAQIVWASLVGELLSELFEGSTRPEHILRLREQPDLWTAGSAAADCWFTSISELLTGLEWSSCATAAEFCVSADEVAMCINTVALVREYW